MWGTTSGLIMSGAAMMHKDISSVTCNQAFYVWADKCGGQTKVGDETSSTTGLRNMAGVG